MNRPPSGDQRDRQLTMNKARNSIETNRATAANGASFGVVGAGAFTGASGSGLPASAITASPVIQTGVCAVPRA
jgi:hypothetical protein